MRKSGAGLSEGLQAKAHMYARNLYGVQTQETVAFGCAISKKIGAGHLFDARKKVQRECGTNLEVGFWDEFGRFSLDVARVVKLGKGHRP